MPDQPSSKPSEAANQDNGQAAPKYGRESRGARVGASKLPSTSSRLPKSPRHVPAAHPPAPSQAHHSRRSAPRPSPSTGQRSQHAALAEAERLLAAERRPERTPSTPQSRLNRTLTIFLIIFGILLLLMLGTLWFVSSQLKPRVGETAVMTTALALLRNDDSQDANSTTFEDNQVFEVMPGWSAKRVAQELAEQGIIANAQLFGLFLRWQGSDTAIGEGLYELSPQMSAWQLSETLARGGRPRTYHALIPEGYRDVDVARSLHASYQQQTAVPTRIKDFLWLMRHDESLQPDFVQASGGTGLEGYLFPARYEIAMGSSPRDIIQQMLARFSQELDVASLAKLETLGLSIHDWVILASIVQSEAGDIEEMPIIAGVFLNRLERGMMLQSDPTVAYGLRKPMNQLSAPAGDFTADADHPWNTYTRTGLPLGPISNPGHHALQAVLHSVRQNDAGQDWLYFLHAPDGGFHPNLDLAAHNADVQRYLR